MIREAKISNFGQVQSVVKTAAAYKEDILVEDCHGSFADAKSILGMMSLDYSHPVTLRSESETAVTGCVKALA